MFRFFFTDKKNVEYAKVNERPTANDDDFNLKQVARDNLTATLKIGLQKSKLDDQSIMQLAQQTIEQRQPQAFLTVMQYRPNLINPQYIQEQLYKIKPDNTFIGPILEEKEAYNTSLLSGLSIFDARDKKNQNSWFRGKDGDLYQILVSGDEHDQSEFKRR